MKQASPKIFWQTFISSSVLLSILAFYQTIKQILALDIILWHSKWIFLLGIFLANTFAGLFAFWWLYKTNDDMGWIEKIENISENRNIALGIVLFVISFLLVWIFRLFLFGQVLPQVTPIFWVFLWATIFQTFGLKLITGHPWWTLFGLTILVQGSIYQIYGHLTIVSNFPFSIGYSEAGRHYYASLFYAKSLYGIHVALPFLHPTRYFLMSLPFLIEGLPLWSHRLWQALLWIGLTGASSILLARRLYVKGWIQIFVALWAFLYFFQGAVYYHLHVCVIFILAGVSLRHPRRSMLFIVIASFWAGASRVNWFPVPAMLAIAIYILESPLAGKGWRYWLTPFGWGASGIVSAFISQFIYIRNSGNADIHSFGSSFTSELLWNRLLPNETFPLGILLGIVIVSAPLVLAVIQLNSGKFSRIHLQRWVALFAMVFILFAGGLVVSVKIGGGADLHNLDAFLVLLAFITTSFFAGRVVAEDGTYPVWGQIHLTVIAAALLIPIGFALPQIGFFPRYDRGGAERDVQKLQGVASDAVANGGKVLLVTERQLLAFDILDGIPLVPEYEQIELMEMAMSGNREYLEAFYSDLEQHRFDIIIAEEQKFVMQKGGAFTEENNAWVRYVGAPILCAYKPIESLSSANVQIFEPRPSRPSCKDPFSE